MVKLVSDRSAEEVARFNLEEELKLQLRDLMAVLLRTMRGAGRPVELPNMLIRMGQLLLDHRELTGAGMPGKFFTEALDLDATLVEFRPWMANRVFDDNSVQDAEKMMVAGALQIAASTLMDQLTQVQQGRHQLLEGMRQRDMSLRRRNAKAK